MLLIVVAVLVLLCGCAPSSVRVVDTNRFGDYDIYVPTALDKQVNRLFPSYCPKNDWLLSISTICFVKVFLSNVIRTHFFDQFVPVELFLLFHLFWISNSAVQNRSQKQHLNRWPLLSVIQRSRELCTKFCTKRHFETWCRIFCEKRPRDHGFQKARKTEKTREKRRKTKKSEGHVTLALWSEWLDLNQRPLPPQLRIFVPNFKVFVVKSAIKFH